MSLFLFVMCELLVYAGSPCVSLSLSSPLSVAHVLLPVFLSVPRVCHVIHVCVFHFLLSSLVVMSVSLYVSCFHLKRSSVSMFSVSPQLFLLPSLLFCVFKSSISLCSLLGCLLSPRQVMSQSFISTAQFHVSHVRVQFDSVPSFPFLLLDSPYKHPDYSGHKISSWKVGVA